MPAHDELESILDGVLAYLNGTLLPFWLDRCRDPEGGGFLTYFDRDGRRTGETDKTFLMQIRTLYTLASAHRAGYGGGRCAELAREGADFILDHYWDDTHGGWIWIADRYGRPVSQAKIGYGQCFGVYAFSEYFLASGDPRGREAALRTYETIQAHMADPARGGYFEIMQRDWQPERPGTCGGDRKSLDVHMHMMEALTALYEMTGDVTHRERLLNCIELVTTRMLHPENGTGYIQFSLDFEPLPAILFELEWGRDAEPADGESQPLDMTSPGHNVEFAWLLLHTADILSIPRSNYGKAVKPLFDHCVNYGIDPEYGGVYADVTMNGSPLKTEKQFWQQAEVLVGMLDAYALFGDEIYWTAFQRVHGFVFEHFVHRAGGGEWFERVDRRGRPIDDALGHAWKINYHTVRSMIQTVARLDALQAADV
jgi:mannose/cellobiose epimerase-like protein (N-acyl-D-glucosamine 2-epimerase family)